MTTFCIGSKVVSVSEFKISSLPAKTGKGVYVYFWSKEFSSKRDYVSKKYDNLNDFYNELRSGMICVFQIKVGE